MQRTAPIARPAALRDTRWDAAVEEHHESLAAYLEAAGKLTEEAWTRPWSPGKWTPAEITEHLALLYEALLRELRTGEGIRIRVHGWRQKMLRTIVLPHILFHRSIPLRVRGPREVCPGAPRAPREALLHVLRELGERCEAELDRARLAGAGHLTHPFFGRLEPVKAMRFIAAHMDHHRAQVERAARG